MTTFFKQHGGSLLVLSFALIVSVAIGTFAHAQTATSTPSGTAGISFPISELGNCGNQDACRAYCNDPSHMDACTAFAQAHGLMNSDDAKRAQQFKNDLEAGKGPGGCATPDACKAYCSDIAHLKECVAFAKGHGVSDENYGQAKKLLDYISGGGTTPGNCNTVDACKAYCADATHATECIAFTKAIGVAPAPQDQEILQKFASLVQSNQTPGGCTTKDACEAYCKDETHRTECVAFAQEMGLVSPEQAAIIQATGGKGPGECDSAAACTAYCNDSSHMDECFQFAVKSGLVKPGDAHDTQDTFTRLRAGIENAPAEVASCILSTIGSSTLDGIQSGSVTPSPEIGQEVKSCFERFGQNPSSTAAFQKAPPQIAACIKDKLGIDINDIQSGHATTTPAMGDAFRICAQEARLQGEGPGDRLHGTSTPPVPPGQALSQFLHSAPAGILPCIKSELGDAFDQIQSGATTSVDTSKLKTCFQNFHPTIQGGDHEQDNNQGEGENHPVLPSAGVPGGTPLTPPHGVPGAMPVINLNCVRNILGDDAILKLQATGTPTPEAINAVRQCATFPQSTDDHPTVFSTPAATGTTPLFDHTPYPQPVPFNGTPSDAEAACLKYNGIWNGSTCTKPSTPPPLPSGDQTSTPTGANLLDVFKPILFMQ